MTLLNLVQQGAELSYLRLHDPEFRSRVHKDHGEIESLVRATAGYGKVARLEQLAEELGMPLDRVDMWAMDLQIYT